MYSEPKFEIIELSAEYDILTESVNWDYKDQIEIDGEIEWA